MTGLKKASLILILSVFSCGDFLFLYPVYDTLAIRWSKYKTSNSFIEDCQHLMNSYAAGSKIPQKEWPASIAEMEPRHVLVKNGYTEIALSTGGIGDSWGLIIVSEHNPEAIPLYATKTKHPRIFRYK